MSAWRLAVRRLYALGGTATVARIDDGTINSLHRTLLSARILGLVSSSWDGPWSQATYTLTEKGWLWCEGKLRDTYGLRGMGKDPKALSFIATWLRAFPEPVQLETPWQLALFD